MGVLSQIVKSFVSCKLHHRDWKKTDVYKGWNMYRQCVKSNHSECKSRIKVYLELRRLYRYWSCFPDPYFRMGMFMNDYNDIEIMKSFVPQVAYYRYSADNDSRYHILIDDKILFHNIMIMYGLPVPERFFVFQDNAFKRGVEIITDEEVDETLEGIQDEHIFIKRYKGGAGSGISIATRSKNCFYNEKGEELTASTIRTLYKGSNYIFEKQIVQENTLKQFNPDSVNTIRVLTYKNTPISAAVRFGGKGDLIDNVSKGGVAVSVDLETGELGEYGMRMYDVKKYYEHPDSHLSFKGVVIPNWHVVIDMVCKTLDLLPYYNSVGFDIAMTDNGPIIIEINTGAGVNLSQMGKKQGLADKFDN